MFAKLRHHIFIAWVSGGQFQSDFHHVLRKQGHPRSAVRLFQVSASGQRRTAIEHTDVVKAEKTALKHVLSESVLSVQPPCVVQQQLSKTPFEKVRVTVPTL